MDNHLRRTTLSPGSSFGIRELLRQGREFDRQQILILIYVPIALAILEYYFLASRSGESFEFIRHSRRAVVPFLWYNAGCLIFMVALPMALAWGIAGLTPRAAGVVVQGKLRDIPVYGVLYLLCLPILVWASRQGSFTSTYPFFKPPNGDLLHPDYLVFEFSYFLQFFAVEYFFRGFMTLGLKPTLGRASILVMVPPYCMIHFHKPFPEAIAAVGAGLLLGTLSWRNGTVIWGWFLHYSVGLTMNVLGHLTRHGSDPNSMRVLH